MDYTLADSLKLLGVVPTAVRQLLISCVRAAELPSMIGRMVVYVGGLRFRALMSVNTAD